MYDNGMQARVAKHDFERALCGWIFAEYGANKFANFAEHAVTPILLKEQVQVSGNGTRGFQPRF
jgi:hypothetical protein